MQKPLFFQGGIANASQKAWPCAQDEIKMSKNQCLFKDFLGKCQKNNSFFNDFFWKCQKTQCFLKIFFANV